jgi:predicted extracellular nuclease
MQRDADGTDTDVNSADFSTAAATPGEAPAETPPPPPVGDPMPIADIQGTTAASPYAGQQVTTDGVVTAAYPTGGFDGFYLQTPGTGGAVDLTTHTASDAIFVYSPSGVGDVAVGDHVQVTGTVSEFNGLTELNVPAAGITSLPDAAEAVKPATTTLPADAAERESLEGMLVSLQGKFTVADNYSLNQYGEITLASGTTPLFQPTDVADPHDAAAIQAVQDENAARSVTLDDGSSWNYITNSTAKDTPLPYLTQERQIRVGAGATFSQPLVFDYRNSLWKLQPTGQLTGDGLSPVTFTHTRTSEPAATGGDLHIASFNVLNYFPTTGAEYVADGGTCSSYKDRAGNPITVNSCNGDGPRGAWDQVSFLRQQAKIVHAINHLGADVVSLEEIENSAKFGEDRDAAVKTLVQALNDDTAPGTWAYVPTPSTAGSQADEDVIRTAFIYKPASVSPVGESMIDDAAAFDNARDPLAQAFKPAGGPTYKTFAVIVNHF